MPEETNTQQPGTPDPICLRRERETLVKVRDAVWVAYERSMKASVALGDSYHELIRELHGFDRAHPEIGEKA